MILRTVITVAILIALPLLYAATKPNTLYIKRSVLIDAPPEKIFVFINDLHRWNDWNREDKEDPTTTRTFGGPAAGVGALCEWDGRGSSGKGRMVIAESEPSRRIAVNVDFVRPFQSHNLNDFTLEPSGNSTKVTWSWQGQNLYFMKVMSVFMNMDKMIGKHFETGLANLKSMAEK